MRRRIREWAIVLPHLIAVTLAAMSAAVAITYRDVETIVSASRWIRHTDEVLISLERVVTSLNEAESGSRGFVITSDPKYLDRYAASRASVPTMLDRIVTLVRDNPGQQERIRELRDATLAKFAEMDKVVAIAKTDGFSAARDEIRTDHGYVLMVSCRDAIEVIRAEEDMLLKKRRKWLNDTFNRMVLTMVILKALAIVFLYFLWRKKVMELKVLNEPVRVTA